MCLSFPAIVADIEPGPMPMGHVTHAGTTVPCCFAYVPEAQAGDYVLIQHGFAIEILDPVSAEESLTAFAELDGSLRG